MKFYSLLPLFMASMLMAETITVSDTYITSQNPQAPSAGGFLLIENSGDEDVYLIGAKADIAQKIELHTHIMKDSGAMEMVEVEGGIRIPAQGCAVLRRGEYHVMFMGVNQTLDAGDEVDVQLEFDNGQIIATEFPIDRERGADYIAPMPAESACNGAPNEMAHEAMKHEDTAAH